MFFSIFSTVLLPLVLVAGLAFLLGRLAKVDPRPLAQASFFLFNPCLAFVSLSKTEVAPELLGRLVLLKLLVLVILILLVRLALRRLNLGPAAGSALMMAAVFANSGNYGMSVSEYAFGQAGLALAVICYVTDNLAMNSIGVYVAARGNRSMRSAVLQVFRNPALYAVLLGLAAHQFHWTVPLPIWRGVESLSRAAVPTMLTVLGLQLAAMPVAREQWRLVSAASFVRLIASPAIAIVVASLLGLTGLARQVGILETAVPTAVLASIIASRYDVEPGFVATNVLVSSIASLVTVTALLTWIT